MRWPLALAWSVAGGLAVAVAAAIWFGAGRRAERADPPAVRLPIARPSVDPYNSASFSFALSPDGRFLASYVRSADGRAALTVLTLATGERREVGGSAVLSPQPPFWSADSRQLVYMTLKATVVFDVVTAATRELCACRFQGGSWNQHGDILLGSSPIGRAPIWRLTLDDRKAVAATTPDAAAEEDSWPSFLPDGRRFVFTRTRRDGGVGTYLGNMDGGVPVRISDWARGRVVTAPDGGGAYLLGLAAAGLLAQPFDLDTMTPAGDPVVVVAGAGAVSASDNGMLATSAPAERPTTQPTWFDRRGVRQAEVGPAGIIQAVALAPDGRSVAMVVTGANRGLWVRDTIGTNRWIGDNGDAPVWSPDGTRVVGSASREGVVNLFERAADGSGRERRLFPAERNAYGNDWSRDGRWLLFTMPKPGGFDLDLHVIRTDGEGDGKPVAYLTGPERDAQAVFSPDGRFVAYTSVGSGDPEVYVRPFPNAADGRWLISPGGGAEPHWSDDGKELFYVAGQTVMAVPVILLPTFSSGTPRKLFDAPVQPWYVNDSDRMQVSPDGERFLLLAPTGANAAPPIDLVVNWPTLLKGR